MAETTMANTTPANITGPEFRIGYVLSQAFSILFRNIVPFGLLAILITCPQLILTLAAGTPDPTAGPAMPFDFGFAAVVGIILQILLPYLLTAALVYGTVQHLRGQRVHFGECLGRGLSLLIPVLGVVILSTLAIGLGFVLLVIPGLIVMTMLWVAIPVAVIERPGVVASLKRSRELTGGHRWKVFGILLILWLLAVVIGAIVALPFGVGLFTGNLDMYNEPSGLLTAAAIVDYAISALFTAAYAVAVAVGYYALRSSKEGVDIEQIAAVFD